MDEKTMTADRATPTQAEPVAWDRMLLAGVQAYNRAGTPMSSEATRKAVTAIYQAMLVAAPPSPAVPEVGLPTDDEIKAALGEVPEVEGLLQVDRLQELISYLRSQSARNEASAIVDQFVRRITAQAEELRVSKDKRADCLERQLIIAQDDLATERAAKEQAEAALRAAERDAERRLDLLEQVMFEGVEHNTNKYAVVQMGHLLRNDISRELDAATRRKGEA